MPAHWQEWEKAKKEMKAAPASRKAAVDEALSILRGAQQAKREDPAALRCPRCGGVKFKTVSKGTEWACRACGDVVRKESGAS